jgi:hypothetical protein
VVEAHADVDSTDPELGRKRSDAPQCRNELGACSAPRRLSLRPV